MAKKFNLANLLDEKNVSNLDKFDVLKIKCSDIQVNSENFFEIANIEELADSIDLIGLQQPLVVTKSNNGYLLIAGHRRFEAIKSLGWDTVPCIVSKPINNELEMLALIQTNTQTRELSYVERMEAVKRTEQILLSLKDKGYKFSGRFRDKIGEIVNESGAAIARMQAIEKNLAHEGKEMLAKGELSPDAAYELQKLTPEKQGKIVEKSKKEKKSPTVKEIKKFKETNVNEVEEIPTLPVWDWKPVSEKPTNMFCDMLLAKKLNGDLSYIHIYINDIDEFNEWVSGWKAQYWCEIQAPRKDE